jgi:predicted ATPase
MASPTSRAGDDPDAGAAVIRESLAAQRMFGSEIARPHQLGLLAEVFMRAGRQAEAATTLDEALAQAARTGDRYYEPELYRLKGDTVRALETARRQGSRLFEQRAAAGFARA